MKECRRVDQTCLFIRYSVLGKHTIIYMHVYIYIYIYIYINELVILFLITLAKKGKKQCLPNDRIAEAVRYIEFFI